MRSIAALGANDLKGRMASYLTDFGERRPETNSRLAYLNSRLIQRAGLPPTLVSLCFTPAGTH
jgi:hypothetical protein